MATTVALVLFGMFALTIVAIVVLGLYAENEKAKVAINAVGTVFGRASKRVLPGELEKSEQTDDTANNNAIT